MRHTGFYLRLEGFPEWAVLALMTAAGASALLVAGFNRLQMRAAGRVNGMCIERKRGGKGYIVGKAYSTIMSSNRATEAFGTSTIPNSIAESESLEKKKYRRSAPKGRA